MSSSPASRAPGRFARQTGSFSPDDVESLRPYVVNLSRGEFSTDGDMQTSKADVDAIFDRHLPAFVQESTQPVPVVIWAHGGIVSERAGADHCQQSAALVAEQRGVSAALRLGDRIPGHDEADPADRPGARGTRRSRRPCARPPGGPIRFATLDRRQDQRRAGLRATGWRSVRRRSAGPVLRRQSWAGLSACRGSFGRAGSRSAVRVPGQREQHARGHADEQIGIVGEDDHRRALRDRRERARERGRARPHLADSRDHSGRPRTVTAAAASSSTWMPAASRARPQRDPSYHQS